MPVAGRRVEAAAIEFNVVAAAKLSGLLAGIYRHLIRIDKQLQVPDVNAGIETCGDHLWLRYAIPAILVDGNF